MPGFSISGIGGFSRTANPTANYFTKFYWELGTIFDTEVQAGSTLVSLKTCTLPTFKVEVETISGAAHKYKHAKSIDWEPVKLSWYDTAGFLPKVKAWRESIWTTSTGLDFPDNYKKTTKIIVMTPDNYAAQMWVLYQSWPATISHGDLSYTDSEIKMVDVDIVYDWADETDQPSLINAKTPT